MTDELKFSHKAEYTGVLAESFGEPPKVRLVTDQETPVCDFQVALGKSERTGGLFDFHKVTAWGSKAELIGTVPVGTWVTVKGYVYGKSYEKKDTGEKVYYKFLKLADTDDALIIHDGQQAANPVVNAVQTELGGTPLYETNASANDIPF